MPYGVSRTWAIYGKEGKDVRSAISSNKFFLDQINHGVLRL